MFLTVAGDNSRSLNINGKFYSPLIDTMQEVMESAGISTLSIARIISKIKGDKSFGRVYAPDGQFARALIQKRLISLFTKAYPYSSFEEKTWVNILRKTGCKAVLAINPSRELCVACRNESVWVADIQHGLISEQHPWYSKECRGLDPIEFLPNEFLVWDKGSAMVLSSWIPKASSRIRIIGHPWVSRFGEIVKDDNFISYLHEKYMLLEVNKISRTVLISLSWGRLESEGEFLPRGLMCIIKRKELNIRWLVRLHPNQVMGFSSREGRLFREFFKKELVGFVEWELATEAPLPLVLKNCTLHITWHSSVVLEAAMCGVKSAILDPLFRIESKKNTGSIKYFHDQGIIDYINDDENTIEAWISQNLSRSKRFILNTQNPDYLTLIYDLKKLCINKATKE
jgi:hypothetical protein